MVPGVSVIREVSLCIIAAVTLHSYDYSLTGLFLGITLLSWVELMLLVFALIKDCCCRCCIKNTATECEEMDAEIETDTRRPTSSTDLEKLSLM